jgi:hypothetical protein
MNRARSGVDTTNLACSSEFYTLKTSIATILHAETPSIFSERVKRKQHILRCTSQVLTITASMMAE